MHDIIDAKGSESATVTLLKGNGAHRQITGLFKPSSGLELDDSMKKSGLIPIYCLSECAWKNFKEHRVLEIV